MPTPLNRNNDNDRQWYVLTEGKPGEVGTVYAEGSLVEVARWAATSQRFAGVTVTGIREADGQWGDECDDPLCRHHDGEGEL